jgi:hypothetical protein
MSTNINRVLPGDVYDAAVNSNTPSIINTFATQLDLANINNPGNANLLISGGASWSGTGMVFNTTFLEYQISGNLLTADPQTVTLPTSNPTNPRFDAIVVDEARIVSVISGIPAANPLTPAIDENYVLLQYVLVGAGATVPTVTNEFVYREGSSPDWLPVSVPGAAPQLVANFSSTFPTPFQGSQCTLVNAPTFNGGKYIQYTKPTGTIPRATFAFLSFRVNLPAALAARNIQVSLFNGTTLIGSVQATAWGLNMSSTNNWQLVSIPTGSFGNVAITTITRIRFFLTGTTANTFSTGIDRYALDDIKFQSGFGPQANVATIDIEANGAPIGSTAKLNFMPTGGTTWSLTNDTVNNKIDVRANSINASITPGLVSIGRNLVSTDAGKFLTVDSATPQTMTIELNSTVFIPIGSVVKITQQGTGSVNIVNAVGVNLYSSGGGTSIPGQYNVATLTKTAINTWYLEFSLI